MYVLISGYWYALINGNIICTHTNESKVRQVYLMEMLCTRSKVLSEVTIPARGCDPLFLVRSFNLL